jgi:hypothetical protein
MKKVATEIDTLPLVARSMNAWGSVEFKCDESRVEDFKTVLKEKHYCWELRKDKETHIHTFTVFIIAKLGQGIVEPA